MLLKLINLWERMGHPSCGATLQNEGWLWEGQAHAAPGSKGPSGHADGPHSNERANNHSMDTQKHSFIPLQPLHTKSKSKSKSKAATPKNNHRPVTHTLT